MPYTLSELIELQSQILATDLDNYDVAPNPDPARQINQALQRLSRAIYLFDPRVVFTPVANESVQDLRDPAVSAFRIVRPFAVIISGTPLREPDGCELGLWPWVRFERWNPSWRTDPSGIPSKAIHLGGAKLLLHPAPSSESVAQGNHFVSGTVLAPDLVQDGDVPAIPEELHLAVAQWAAVLAAEPSATELTQLRLMQTLRESSFELIREMAGQNRRALAPFASGCPTTRLMES